MVDMDLVLNVVKLRVITMVDIDPVLNVVKFFAMYRTCIAKEVGVFLLLFSVTMYYWFWYLF